jgi:hypothetical protein
MMFFSTNEHLLSVWSALDVTASGPVQFKNLDWGSGLFGGDETERQIDRSGNWSIKIQFRHLRGMHQSHAEPTDSAISNREPQRRKSGTAKRGLGGDKSLAGVVH